MNRTITMNLNGIIFHIEENAYEKLNSYLATIKSYFKTSEGRDEIINDIESRISELLQEKVSATKQAVMMADVEHIISVMGKPEDFANDNENNSSSTNSKENENFNSASFTHGKRKKVFRDTDDKILGGVCAGVANYFDFDPIWLRAAFALSFFVFGTGFLLYIILWIIIPAAKTTAEKLEMRGEKVDINNIGKAVNDEFEDLKKRMKDYGTKAKSPENREKIKTATLKAGDFLNDVFHNIIKVFGKIIAVLLIFIGIALLIGTLVTIFGRSTISAFGTQGNSIHFSLYEFCEAFLPSNISMQLVVLGLILFVGMLVLSIIFSGIRLLFGIKERNKIISYSANILWLLGLGILIYIAVETGLDFSEQVSTKQKIELLEPKSSVFYLDINPTSEDDLDETYTSHRKIHFGDWTMLSKNENKFRLAYPTLTIIKSENTGFELIAVKTANGFDKKEASYRAKSIDYVVNQKDSTLFFNSFYDIKSTEKLRSQEVKLILKVPVNKTIYLSKKMEKIIFDIDNVNDAFDNDMVNRKWMMTSQGLECIDCEGLEKIEKHKKEVSYFN